MPPNTTTEDSIAVVDKSGELSKVSLRKYEIVYWNVMVFAYYHIAALYGAYILFTSAIWYTILFNVLLFWLSAVGIIAGVHRLWSHKSYKATIPLQIFLVICQTISNQHSVVHWVRDHRLHHKYSDTDADPHNASRGFFYSHIGWLLVKKHPEVKERGKLIDIGDVTSNPILMFQHRYNWFIPVIGFVLPTIIPNYFWGESYTNAWHVNMLRYILNLNLTFCINSFAHMYGYRPYNKSIAPSQNMFVYWMTLGEGFHNYHHVFPCDYRSNEFGKVFNIMTNFILLCEKFGLAYDLKTISEEVARAQMLRSGDGTSPPGYLKTQD